MKKIAAFVPNILGVSPGQRLRIEAWAKLLPDFGWEVEFFPFENNELNKVLYNSGKNVSKLVHIALCYGSQLKRVLNVPQCDVLFIYREATLIGPAILERLLKNSGVPIVYDIDDPVFLPYRSPVNKWFSSLKFSRKTHTLFRLSDHIISINKIMGDYAKQFNPNLTVIPNFVDTEVYSPKPKKSSEKVSIVWTGSVSTMQNLVSIAEPLRRVQKKYDIPLRIVGSGTPDLKDVKIDFRQWTMETEVSDLQDCDIGLVPLLDLEWNPWKFYLKTIQYMAVGLPVVAHKMGSNSEVIEHGVNGFVVESEDEWVDCLSLLIENHTLRKKMGEAARQTVIEKYSVQFQMPRVAEVFENVLKQTKKKKEKIELID